MPKTRPLFSLCTGWTAADTEPAEVRKSRAGAIRRAVVVAAAAALFMGSVPMHADDGAVYDRLARELLEGIGEKVGARAIRAAVIPFDPANTPIDAPSAEEVTMALESAMARAPRPSTTPDVDIRARTGLGAVFAALSEAGALDQNHRERAVRLLRESGDVDVMIVGRLHPGNDGYTARFQAVDVDTGILLAGTPKRNVPIETTPARDSVDQAVGRIAGALAERVGDMSVLLVAGVRYQDTGHRTPFSRWIQEQVTTELQEGVHDPLTGRKLAVRPLGLSDAELHGLHRRPVPDWSGTLSAHPDRGPGVYVLAGSYWVHPNHIELAVGLYDSRGRVDVGRGRMRRDDARLAGMGGLRPGPDSDFGFLTATDGQGPFRFSLTTPGGRSPEFAIGDPIHLVVSSEIDAWISCYFWGRNHHGRHVLTRFLPNELMQDGGHVRSGRAYTIPGKGASATREDPYPFDLTAKGPPGVDFIKCFATDRDVSDDLPAGLGGRTFAEMPEGTAERLSAAFRETGAKVAENSMVVTIVEGNGDGA